MKLANLGEDKLLLDLLSRSEVSSDVILSAGHDCAVVRSKTNRLLVLKCDCVVEGVHFKRSASPEAVGWKAMMRPLSDFAAVSALPRYALITLMVPGSTSRGWVDRVYTGLKRAGDRYQVGIVGGETSRTPGPASLSVAVVGFVERSRWTSRSGGKAGDDLFVTGRLGGSLGGRHLKFTPRIDEARWLTANFHVHAMMDLSDGLGTDLPRLARASRVGFEIEEGLLPLNPGCTAKAAVSDGEDYELLFAVNPGNRRRLLAKWKRQFPRVRLTRIGQLTKPNKSKQQKLARGYVHFQ